MVKLLAFHAHPDDVDFLCAGTLALLAAQGHEIAVVTATAGEGGSRTTDADETRAIRLGEAAAAAAEIGASYRCAGLPDLGVFNDDPSRRAVTEILRAAAPDIVLTGSPIDYHPDHEATSLLVRDACFATSVPNYQTGPAKPLVAVPHLYFMDAIGGRDREGRRLKPDFGVDITSFIETKQRMLTAHRSQVGWVADQHHVPDLVKGMVDWAARRGRDFGVPYAEGFRHYRHEPYPRSPLLQELVGDALKALTNWRD